MLRRTLSRIEAGCIERLSRLLGWELPEGVGWTHTLGSAALTALLVQGVTGILLALYYAATPNTAWESIRYIEEQVLAGSFIRGLHYWGASALVVVMALHLCRVFYWGAYRPPRQWTWTLGVLLMLTVLAAAFTGYLLPWDLKAYFATQVGAEITGSVPVVGQVSRVLMLGGERIGGLTLTRFHVVHVVILPLAMLILIAGHLALVRRNGSAPSWKPATGKSPGRFFPDHAWKDGTASLGLVLLLAGLAAVYGAPLEAKADPAVAGYIPRPEWYFLPLFQLLKYFDGPWSLIGTVVLPGAGLALMLALPWLDRAPSSSPSHRRPLLALGTLCAGAVLGLLLAAVIESPTASHAEAPSGIIASGEAASAPAQPPVPQPGRTAKADPGAESHSSPGSAEDGERLYRALRCAACHEGDTRTGPDLSLAGSRLTRTWMKEYLVRPYRIRWADTDRRPEARMPDFQLTAQEASHLTAYLATRVDPARVAVLPESQGVSKEQIAEGRELFDGYMCLGCHRLGGEGTQVGPDLEGSGKKYSLEYLRAFLESPDALVPGNPMKELQLWPEEAHALAAYLSTR